MKAIAWIFSSLAAFFMFCVWIGGLALHVYTIICAYAASGLFAAIVTFLVPFASELFWFGWFWWKTGILMNGYSGYVVSYVFCIVGAMTCGLVASWFESRIKES